MSNKQHKVCIRTKKVYDWVQRQVELPLMHFSGEDFEDLFECKDNGFTPEDDICDFLRNKDFTVRCLLVPDSILAQEIKQPKGRQQVTTKLPSGEKVTLEKVKVLVKGLVDIEIYDAMGRLLCRTIEPIEFATAQTFFLCAPDGTKIVPHVTYFQCDADVICTENFQQLDISILLCLEVQAEAEVKLEVEAAICKPREELPIADIVCPEDRFPPQCPEIFPAHDRKKC